MKISKIKLSTVLLVALLLILMHNFFYLAPTKIGPIRYNDLLSAFCLLLFVYYWYVSHGRCFSGAFSKVILFVPVLIITSSLAAGVNYNQGVIWGLLTQRNWLCTMLLYFPLHYLISTGKFTLEQLKKILFCIVFCELVLYFLQFYVGESHIFLNYNYNIRYDTLRLYCSINYMVLVMTFAAEELMAKKKIIINICWIVSVLAYVFIVNKGRSAVIESLLYIMIVILFSKSKPFYKAVIILLGLYVAVYYLNDASTITEFFAAISGTVTDATYYIRLESQNFFMEKWMSSLVSILLGYGFANSNIISSMIATGVTQGYLLADNGIYGFIVSYGLIGILWLVAYEVLAVSKAFKIWRKHGSITMLSIVVVQIAILPVNVSFFYSIFAFNAVLIMCTLELLQSKYEINKDVILECRKPSKVHKKDLRT